MRVRFGDFVFDAGRRELSRDGAAVPLSPKAFDLLALLIRHAPRALRKEEIYDRLWPKTFVEYANLNNLVSEVRSALGDRDRSVIQTKRRFGFAFASPIERIEDGHPGASAARIFRIILGGRSIDLPPGRNLIGRDPDCAVILDAPAVSRHHAAIEVGPAGAELHDLGSKNGTFVRHRRVSSIPLEDGDVIEIGRTLLRVRLLERNASTVTEGI